ncbi:hypothetical protein V8C37DRAFT_339939 [Trichoderma ceciliae]
MTLFSKMLPLVLLVVLAARVNATCFFPDGSTSGDVPCTDTTKNSACCGFGYACLSNGICQATGEELQKPGASEFVRGSCTDKTWRSSDCQTFCINPALDSLAGGEGLEKCTNTSQDIYWCINDSNLSLNKTQNPCNNQNDIVFFPGTPRALTTIGVTPSSTFRLTTLTTMTTSSSSSPTGTSPSTATSSLTPSAETTSSSDTTKSSNGGVIGGAVGGSVAGVAVIGLLAFFFLRRRRSRAGIHETDYTPVQLKGSATPIVPPTHTVQNAGGLHEAPGSTHFVPAKVVNTTTEAPMELAA